jgi:hypothetical protein
MWLSYKIVALNSLSVEIGLYLCIIHVCELKLHGKLVSVCSFILTFLLCMAFPLSNYILSETSCLQVAVRAV